MATDDDGIRALQRRIRALTRMLSEDEAMSAEEFHRSALELLPAYNRYRPDTLPEAVYTPAELDRGRAVIRKVVRAELDRVEGVLARLAGGAAGGDEVRDRADAGRFLGADPGELVRTGALAAVPGARPAFLQSALDACYARRLAAGSLPVPPGLTDEDYARITSLQEDLESVEAYAAAQGWPEVTVLASNQRGRAEQEIGDMVAAAVDRDGPEVRRRLRQRSTDADVVAEFSDAVGEVSRSHGLGRAEAIRALIAAGLPAAIPVAPAQTDIAALRRRVRRLTLMVSESEQLPVEEYRQSRITVAAVFSEYRAAPPPEPPEDDDDRAELEKTMVTQMLREALAEVEGVLARLGGDAAGGAEMRDRFGAASFLRADPAALAASGELAQVPGGMPARDGEGTEPAYRQSALDACYARRAAQAPRLAVPLGLSDQDYARISSLQHDLDRVEEGAWALRREWARQARLFTKLAGLHRRDAAEETRAMVAAARDRDGPQAWARERARDADADAVAGFDARIGEFGRDHGLGRAESVRRLLAAGLRGLPRPPASAG